MGLRTGWKMKRIGLALLASVVIAPRLCAVPPLHYRFDRQWGQYGQGDGEFYSPARMNISGGILAVADRDNHRIQLFDLDGGFLAKYGTLGSGQDSLNSPFEPDFDAAGYVYIPDWGNGRLMKRTSALAYVADWGTEGSGEEQLLGPRGLAVDRVHGWVFVADTLNHRISKWDLNGTHLLNFGTGGTAPGEFNQPHDVAVGFSYVYVADTENNRVQKFDPDGHFVKQWRASGGGLMLHWPAAVTVAPNGRLFVSDTEHNRIVQYTSAGAYVNAFGSFGHASGQFEIPVGLAVDAGNRVFVADTHHHRIQRFRLNSRPSNPTSLYVTPNVPSDGDSLCAHASGSTDADGDVLNYRYRWFGSPDRASWTQVKDVRILPASYTTPGQWYRCQVHVWDGYDYSQWATSPSVKVQGAPAGPALVAVAQETADGNVAVTITLTASASLELQLRNIAGRTVATSRVLEVSSGTSTVPLRAVSAHGTKLPAGQYLLGVTMRSPAGETTACLTSVYLH